MVFQNLYSCSRTDVLYMKTWYKGKKTFVFKPKIFNFKTQANKNCNQYKILIFLV